MAYVDPGKFIRRIWERQNATKLTDEADAVFTGGTRKNIFADVHNTFPQIQTCQSNNIIWTETQSSPKNQKHL